MCLVYRLSLIRKLTEFLTSYFYDSAVKTPARVLGLFKEWRTGVRTPILGRFLSCSSVWQGYQVLGVLIITMIQIWGTN